jgi:hypothetical protein
LSRSLSDRIETGPTRRVSIRELAALACYSTRSWSGGYAAPSNIEVTDPSSNTS